jgi:hypothetical protein
MQAEGALPTPCAWIMFDSHRDDLEPQCKEILAKVKQEGLTTTNIVELCASNLKKLDDDWLKAGMELGMFSDVVVFGADDTFNAHETFVDHAGTQHRIKFCGLPGGALQYQGDLSDLAKSSGLRPLWDILGWEPGKGFRTDLPKIGLDFDLDCFAYSYRDCTLAWPEELFEKEFLVRSTYRSTEGYSAQDFIRGLVSRAGLITIAREPTHCGGQAKADWILGRLNHYVFDDGLQFP